MASVREKYPLDAEEESTLIANLAMSQALLLVVGCIGVAIIDGVVSGNWSNAFLGMGWARAIAESLAALPLADTCIYTLTLAVVLYGLSWFAQRRALQTTMGRESVLEARRDVNGEFPRLKTSTVIAIMLGAGCAEELLFRYVAINGLLLIFNLVMTLPAWFASFCALIISSFAFWLAHVRYRDFFSTVLTMFLAIALGVAYMATGSLAVVIIAHAAYDIAEVLMERYYMSKDDDYFGGPAPKRALLDQLEEIDRHFPDDFGRL